MTNFERIRTRLEYSQSGIATALGMSQPNVSKIENGQDVSPEVARKLIALAKETHQIELSYDDIYCISQNCEAA